MRSEEEGELQQELDQRNETARSHEAIHQGADAFIEGEEAEHKFGVLYQGEWETEWDGTASAVRLHARALAARVPVLLKSFSGTVVSQEGVLEHVCTAGVSRAVREEVNGLNNSSIATLVPVIKHVVVSDATTLRRLIVPRSVVHSDPVRHMDLLAAIYANTIVYSVWERDRISSEMALVLARVKECWVPCEQNAEMLRAAGVARVRVVPHPIDPDDLIHKCRRRNPAKHQARRFYTIGRWEPRKDQHQLLGAFLKAFRPGDDATLTIKYSGAAKWPDYPGPEQSLKHWLGKLPHWNERTVQEHVYWNEDRVPRSQIVGLHLKNNIYVSSSHGEAWCLPAFDARLAGNRLVHVPWGGTADFDGDDDVRVPYEMGAVHESYNWEEGAQWAVYRPESLASALLAARPPTSFELPPNFEDSFGMEAVGKRMFDLALPVAADLVPQAADYYRGLS